jgi:hypothetical protein
VLDDMGPGDRLLMCDVGDGFDAHRQTVECILPEVDSRLTLKPASYPEYSRQKVALSNLWAETVRQKDAFLGTLGSRRIATPSSTDIYVALEYASHRANTPGEHSLIICSDFVQDYRGAKSEFPPRHVYPFPRAAVSALFVPWQGFAASAKKVTAWTEYFKQAGAAQVAIFDEAQSRTVRPIPPSSVPRQPQNPFKKG